MTLDRFQQLEARQQVTIAFLRGTRLMRQLTSTGNLMLYHIDNGQRGFFVELEHDHGQGRAVVRRIFTGTIPLSTYLDNLSLEVSFD